VDVTKNVALFAIACTMYMICGYEIMYPDLGSIFLSGITADGVAGAEEPATYAPAADFFFQVVFVATAMSICNDWFHLPNGRFLDLEWFCGIWYVYIK